MSTFRIFKVHAGLSVCMCVCLRERVGGVELTVEHL